MPDVSLRAHGVIDFCELKTVMTGAPLPTPTARAKANFPVTAPECRLFESLVSFT